VNNLYRHITLPDSESPTGRFLSDLAAVLGVDYNAEAIAGGVRALAEARRVLLPRVNQTANPSTRAPDSGWVGMPYCAGEACGGEMEWSDGEQAVCLRCGLPVKPGPSGGAESDGADPRTMFVPYTTAPDGLMGDVLGVYSSRTLALARVGSEAVYGDTLNRPDIMVFRLDDLGRQGDPE
jgi:hypothetical protein